MASAVVVAFTVLVLCELTGAHENTPPFQQQQDGAYIHEQQPQQPELALSPNPGGPSISGPSESYTFRKRAVDREHARHHLEEEAAVDPAEMSEQELVMYYFRQHDSDHDQRLDGLEIYRALRHSHHGTGEGADGGDEHHDMTEDDACAVVDQILDTDDINKDGYVDLIEFATSTSRKAQPAE